MVKYHDFATLLLQSSVRLCSLVSDFDFEVFVDLLELIDLVVSMSLVDLGY